MRLVIVIPGSLLFLTGLLLFGGSRSIPGPTERYPSPQNADEFLSRGELYQEAGEYEKALRDFEQAAQLEPENSTAYVEQGSVLSELDEPAAAIEKYQTAADISRREGTSPHILNYLIEKEKERF